MHRHLVMLVLGLFVWACGAGMTAACVGDGPGRLGRVCLVLGLFAVTVVAFLAGLMVERTAKDG